jgi:hypothetical protein
VIGLTRLFLTMPVGVAALFSEILLSLERFDWGSHFPIAVGVLLERWSHARFTRHRITLLPMAKISTTESIKP